MDLRVLPWSWRRLSVGRWWARAWVLIGGLRLSSEKEPSRADGPGLERERDSGEITV
jgi:hypothetical protein